MKTDLVYDEFKEYEVVNEGYEVFKKMGESFDHLFRFENGYGASVIKHPGSIRYKNDLFELAVVKFSKDGTDWGLCYDTTIADNVIGHLRNEEVIWLLKQIRDLGKENMYA